MMSRAVFGRFRDATGSAAHAGGHRQTRAGIDWTIVNSVPVVAIERTPHSEPATVAVLFDAVTVTLPTIDG